MSGWGCPHEINDRCTRINGLPCDPGMKGCVLYGRYRFANDEKNERWLKKQEKEAPKYADESIRMVRQQEDSDKLDE